MPWRGPGEWRNHFYLAGRLRERRWHLTWALEYSHLPAEKEGKIRPSQGEGLARANNNSKAWKYTRCSGHRAIQLGLDHGGARQRGAGEVAAQQGKDLIPEAVGSHGDFQTHFSKLFLSTIWSTDWKVERDRRQSRRGTSYGCLSGMGQVEKTELGTHFHDLKVAFLLGYLHLQAWVKTRVVWLEESSFLPYLWQ